MSDYAIERDAEGVSVRLVWLGPVEELPCCTCGSPLMEEERTALSIPNVTGSGSAST